MSQKPDAYEARHSLRAHNWLVHRIHDRALSDALHQYGAGVLLDIGCGEKPYRTLTRDVVSQHVGLDHPESLHSGNHVNLFATAYQTAVASNSVDTILCTAVLEHLERPQAAICEMYRILSREGMSSSLCHCSGICMRNRGISTGLRHMG